MSAVIYQLSKRSQERLDGVHPHLVTVVRGAILKSPVDFTVVEGLRSLERQKQLFAEGRSKTMKSRHLTGHAVDLVPLIDLNGDGIREATWIRESFFPVVDAMRASAAAHGILIEWGGDWQWQDCPHFQLPWSRYP